VWSFKSAIDHVNVPNLEDRLDEMLCLFATRGKQHVSQLNSVLEITPPWLMCPCIQRYKEGITAWCQCEVSLIDGRC
jgi:hypothetical protein